MKYSFSLPAGSNPVDEMKQRVDNLCAELRVLDVLIPELEKQDWLRAAVARNKYNNIDKECMELMQIITKLEE